MVLRVKFTQVHDGRWNGPFREYELGVTESDAFTRLTPRERRCLELVALHYDTAQIAQELDISVTTVSSYLADARRKLGARNRKEAVRMLAAITATPPPVPPPPNIGGDFEGVEAQVPVTSTLSPQPNNGSVGEAAQMAGIGRMLLFDRSLPPGQFGPATRLGMIVALVVALAAALALAVIAVVGLVSISASLRS